MNRRFLVAFLAVAGLAGGSVVVAQAQLTPAPFIPVPNLAIAPNTVCLDGFIADPVYVSDTQRYQCASPVAVCKTGWIPGGMAVEAVAGGGWRFVYYCTPASQVPR